MMAAVTLGIAAPADAQVAAGHVSVGPVSPSQSAAAPILAGKPGAGTPLPAESLTTTDTGLTLGRAQNRMTVPVSIAAAGPWGFVIDTGAERTVVSRELAGQLGLQPGPTIRIVAMTGPSAVPTVIVPSLSVSSVAATTVTAPSLEQRDLGAPGMLGIDALQGHRIDIDFLRSSMTVKPSRKRFTQAGSHGDEVVVVARSLYGQLIVTDARWRGKRIAVVIDTGSSMTVGNPALLALVGSRARSIGPMTAVSVTGATLTADVHVVDDLAIGGIGLDQVSVAFADAAPFRRFGLTRRPALLLGMDTLRMFRRVRIDFANRDIIFTMPHRGDGPHVNPSGGA